MLIDGEDDACPIFLDTPDQRCGGIHMLSGFVGSRLERQIEFPSHHHLIDGVFFLHYIINGHLNYLFLDGYRPSRCLKGPRKMIPWMEVSSGVYGTQVLRSVFCKGHTRKHRKHHPKTWQHVAHYLYFRFFKIPKILTWDWEQISYAWFTTRMFTRVSPKRWTSRHSSIPTRKWQFWVAPKKQHQKVILSTLGPWTSSTPQPVQARFNGKVDDLAVPQSWSNHGGFKRSRMGGI